MSLRIWKSIVSVKNRVKLSVTLLAALSLALAALGQFAAQDPGPRAGTIDAGQPLASVAQTTGASAYFTDGRARFQEIETPQSGLGPRFNTNQCASCHSQPAVGGSSPSATAFPYISGNPETLVYDLSGAKNQLPSFVTSDGPAREARFKYFVNANGSLGSTPDGGVHDLYSITGRSDANGCSLAQPDFEHNLALGNVIYRIPTPTFGAGLIENIPDETILANMNANSQAKQSLGISGRPNRSGNDGTITRFGWKAQNKSLEIFAGEAYNVEMGVSNELFPNKRSSPDEAGLPTACRMNPTPEDKTSFTAAGELIPSDVVAFAMFMRLLAPPTPSATVPGGADSISRGRSNFIATGCALCHTPTMTTAASSFTPGLSNVNANLYSDLLLHQMGANLADGVSQGGAGPNEFRTAPLWGLGQRAFFLHDGRTTSLLDAIRAHAGQGSEANGVIAQFHSLTEQQKQDLLNFLRSL